MELQTAFETRRSIRHYDAEKKVTKEQVETLIKAASLAPSWKNTQTSRYYCCLLYTSPSPRDGATSRMPSSA